MQMTLENKRVLMFCEDFFGYREQMAGRLRKMGAQVDLYDERPSNGTAAKIALRLGLGIYRRAVRRYYRGILEECGGGIYDYVFVVKGEVVDKEVVEALRERLPEAEFILYLWDAVANIPDGEKKLPLYDRVYTFDPVDARDFGLRFRPLYFGKEYGQPAEEPAAYRYDMAFIGTAHSIRPRVVRELERSLQEQGRSCFSFLFLPHPLVYFHHKLRNPAYRGVRKADIHFRPLDGSVVREIYQTSRCVLDVEHPDQRGLTARTIELLGMGKKIVTTNQWISQYDFYNANNICVIDREHPAVDESFFGQAYEKIPDAVLAHYTLSAFIGEIFGIKEYEHGE